MRRACTVLALAAGHGIRVWMSEPRPNATCQRDAGVWIELSADDPYTAAEARTIAANLLKAADRPTERSGGGVTSAGRSKQLLFIDGFTYWPAPEAEDSAGEAVFQRTELLIPLSQCEKLLRAHTPGDADLVIARPQCQ